MGLKLSKRGFPEGRPSKYKSEYNQMLIDHMASGLSYESFCGLISVDLTTLYEWEKVHPEFSQSKKDAFNKNRLFWEKAGTEGMFMGGQHNPFNATVWIFNMKNRFPKEWRDRKEVVADITTHEVVDKEQLKKMAQLILDDE